MSMGDNIRIEEEAKVDGLRAVNNMLRDENRRLREALAKVCLELECSKNPVYIRLASWLRDSLEAHP